MPSLHREAIDSLILKVSGKTTDYIVEMCLCIRLCWLNIPVEVILIHDCACTSRIPSVPRDFLLLLTQSGMYTVPTSVSFTFNDASY